MLLKNGKVFKDVRLYKKMATEDYCDTNILTAFVNRKRLKIFGGYGFNKHKDKIKSLGYNGSEEKSLKINKCIISRDALLSGKRLSKSGNTYWETRKNRSDAKGSKI